MASGHLLVGPAHFADSKNTPLLLPTSILKVQTEPILTKCLLSLVVQLVLQFRLSRICVEKFYHDSRSALRKLSQIPESCPYFEK